MVGGSGGIYRSWLDSLSMRHENKLLVASNVKRTSCCEECVCCTHRVRLCGLVYLLCSTDWEKIVRNTHLVFLWSAANPRQLLLYIVCLVRGGGDSVLKLPWPYHENLWQCPNPSHFSDPDQDPNTTSTPILTLSLTLIPTGTGCLVDGLG